MSTFVFVLIVIGIIAAFVFIPYLIGSIMVECWDWMNWFPGFLMTIVIVGIVLISIVIGYLIFFGCGC